MDKNINIKQKTFFGAVWKMLQSITNQFVSFAISIVLARILVPEDYGLIALVNIFTNISLVFVNVGFASSIIHKKDLKENDVHTLFYSSISLAIILYGIIFAISPFVASFYRQPALTALLRVGSLIIPICSLYSIHQSLLTRALAFKKLFISSFVGVCVQGVVGIILATNNFGAWALIFSNISNFLMQAIILWCIVNWRPRLVFSICSFKENFSFSLKILLSELLNSLFNNVRSIIIGRQYSSSDLAFYNKGNQFPTLLMTSIDGSVTTITFSALSKLQSNWKEQGLGAMRKMMKASMFICMPMMIGLVVIARPLILVLLTEKWLDSVIFVQLGAIICLFWPLSAQRHALNARGYTGVSLRLNIVSKIITIILLLLTYKISVTIMIASTIMASVFNLIVSSLVYRKYLDYSIRDQIYDISSAFITSIIMAFCIYPIKYIGLNELFTLIVQILLGMCVYIGIAFFRRDETLYYIKNLIKVGLSKN